MYLRKIQPQQVGSLFLGIAFLLAVSLSALPATASAFADGDGSEETPFRIETCEDLQDMNNDLDAFYVLANDIDCSETVTWNGGAGFEPIGQYDNPFLGELDGDSHVISGLFIDTTLGGNSPGGLFDRLGQFDNQVGLVKDVGLENINVKGGWSTGGLVGVLYGQANNTYTTGSVEGSGEVGGLVGSHGGIWDTVIDSWSSATVIGTSDVVGGLVGYNAQDSQIINSYATGLVTGGGDFVGGLVGVNSGNLENSHATGDVATSGSIGGGLVGENRGTVTHSYATGYVTGRNNIGGLVGELDNGEISQSYSRNDVGGDNNVGVDGECQVGGLVGYSNDGRFFNVFSRSSVDSIDSCGEGGLIGRLVDGEVVYGYSTGQVNSEASDVKGGFIGFTDTDSIWSSFWDTDTTSLTDGCGTSSTGVCSGVDKVNGKTTAEMKTESPYVDPVLGEGAWLFASLVGSENAIWEIDPGVNDGYPFFINSIGATPVDWPDPEEEQDSQDLNGDEIPDSEQPNVGGYVSTITGKIVAIDVGEECELTTDDTTTESNFAVQDAAFDYDNGLWDFEADCGTPGYTTTVKLYYYNVNPTGLVLRKHNPTTNAYFTISDAVITAQTIDDQSVTVVTYQVTDGGERDVDGVADGMINDPAGLARSLVGAPNTGIK